MRIAASVSTRGKLSEALSEAISGALEGLTGAEPHLGVLTLTNHFEDEAAAVAEQIRARTRVQTLIGCTAEGVIGPTEEVERQPGVALWLASLPNVRIRGFHLHPTDLESVETVDELHRLLRVKDVTDPNFLMLADPFFTPYVIGLLEAIGKVYPNRPVLGGMASGVEAEEQSALILDDDIFHEGAVGAVLSGDVLISPVVSQGCRPIGKPFIITAADRNVIRQLGGRPALNVLNEVLESAPARDRELVKEGGLFVGRAISEYQETFRRGDFLIRNVIGAEPENKSIHIGDMARVGTTVQFHVRDAESADQDLRSLLRDTSHLPAGGLVFSCNGRGTKMFNAANHDLEAIRDILGDVPVAGLFCAGEIGPVSGQTFVHGHTASIALFSDKA